MKKLLIGFVISVMFVSCYKDEYIKDYDYNSVYFPYQADVRTLIVGEGMEIEIGVALGGVRENTENRNVAFTVDNSLITPLTLTLMKGGSQYIKDAVVPVTMLLPLPVNYYTLSDNSKIVIKAGEHMGSVVLKVDSSLFLSDPKTLYANYVIPFYITSADADTILQSKRSAVIGIKYENMLFGNYWHGGVTIVKDATGATIQTIPYYTAINQPENKIWKLKTIAPNTLVTNGYSDQTTAKNEMKLTLDGNNIIVTTNVGSTFTVQADGTSTFNRANKLQSRKILLNYKYINAVGNTCYAQDTLTFRNRIQDGVNVWQN